MHKFLIHSQGDLIGVITQDVKAGEKIIGKYMDSEQRIEIIAGKDIPLGHKIAIGELAEGATVIEYGHPIGIATSKIVQGDYVHTHNIKSARW